MPAPRHPVKARPGGRPAAVPASLLTHAAPVSAATATVKNPPSHPARRPAPAGPTPRSSPARHPLARPRSRAIRLPVARSGYDTPAGSAAAPALQRALAAGWAPGPIDGRPGPLSTQALKRFQAARGLALDGIAGPHTRRAVALIARGAAGQAPRERPASRTRPAPSDRPPPQPSSAQRRTPGLPAARVRLGLAALGLPARTLGYARARPALANQPRAQHNPGLARPMWHPGNGAPVASSNREGER
jgi:peptidoglycan hydrolase-like protein with peptidoglycan-binding domain